MEEQSSECGFDDNRNNTSRGDIVRGVPDYPKRRLNNSSMRGNPDEGIGRGPKNMVQRGLHSSIPDGSQLPFICLPQFILLRKAFFDLKRREGLVDFSPSRPLVARVHSDSLAEALHYERGCGGNALVGDLRSFSGSSEGT